MRLSRSSLAVLLVALVACGAPARPAEPAQSAPPTSPAPVAGTQEGRFRVEMVAAAGEAAVLEGVIRDGAGKAPMAGVTIVVVSPALQGERVEISDADGRFAFQALPPGTYTLTAIHEEATTTTSVALQTGKRAKLSLDWNLTAGAPVSRNDTPAPPKKFPDARTALQAGAVNQAYRQGQQELAKAPSSRLHGLLAIAAYGSAVEALVFEVSRAADGGFKASKLRDAVVQLVAELDKVQEHLAAAAKDPTFSLELCVACMGVGDDAARFAVGGALEVESDRSGKRLPEGDPRRRPTYLFDHGDLAWARAMVSFQQAFANIALAYDWSFFDTLEADRSAANPRVTIRMADPGRVARAKELLLAALAFSDQARTAYLAEKDDDREWVPNPAQKNYPSPLAMDAKLYKTWASIVGDARALVSSETGLSLAAMWKVLRIERGRPTGFVDFGAMLTTPKEIVFDVATIEALENEKNPKKSGALMTKLLGDLLGNGYKPKMKPSPITDRLLQLRKDLDQGGQAVELKLKYLLWLN
ncbi:MAG: carboxypeptidase regulatory-like domain-containing protein [Deltaproteobacteria bacterium]|nr:carboxypeptidase regulatory-like domain-containing protein [Deltaproteobacteria bacterium]